MTTAVIGRILATSLYQAISERLPLRVEFYESWLSPKGFTARRVSLSGVRAVFSFLRREEAGYDAIVRRAGDLAANWLFDDLPPLRRRLMLALPRGLRMRAALSLARSFVKEIWSQSEVKVRSGLLPNCNAWSTRWVPWSPRRPRGAAWCRGRSCRMCRPGPVSTP